MRYSHTTYMYLRVAAWTEKMNKKLLIKNCLCKIDEWNLCEIMHMLVVMSAWLYHAPELTNGIIRTAFKMWIKLFRDNEYCCCGNYPSVYGISGCSFKRFGSIEDWLTPVNGRDVLAWKGRVLICTMIVDVNNRLWASVTNLYFFLDKCFLSLTKSFECSTEGNYALSSARLKLVTFHLTIFFAVQTES